MRVYIIMRTMPNQETHIMSVHDDFDKAKKIMKEFYENQESILNYYEFSIEMWEVQ